MLPCWYVLLQSCAAVLQFLDRVKLKDLMGGRMFPDSWQADRVRQQLFGVSELFTFPAYVMPCPGW